ncbi:hypothetical protein [uncultured Desulfosarcina sp.]|uniref:hypothetical protein n=1 Tax=uncultured Desulfosarcina sp. TaxID=218289 RepID=UPI0029C6BAC6|nr:hypothetical protein [uncultured Desulfosarcina sp.]
MESVEEKSFNALVEQQLGTRLPPRLCDKISFSALSTNAKGVILRLLTLMKRSSCPATEINSQMIWLLASVTPGMLPSAWGGHIPPVTAPGRHKKLDDYVKRQFRAPVQEQPVYIDIGCGFPPATTIDTAKCLPDWSVFGIDRSFSRYVLYDIDGNYACFNRHGKLQYIQAPKKPLNEQSDATRDRFQSLFNELRSQLTICDEHTRASVEKNGNRLVYNHIRDFEGKNLRFLKSDIDHPELPPACAGRCMNVLLYFERDIREAMLSEIFALIADGGLLITGFNHPFGIYSRYSVYTKDGAGIRPLEFSFSLDNLRPLGVGPWLTLADDDREAELLADLTGAIRADRSFWTEFNAYVDRLRAEYGICDRDKDGFIFFTEYFRNASPGATKEKVAALWAQLENEGYTDGAIEALGRAGYQAWKNPVGDIAVLPPEGSLPAS